MNARLFLALPLLAMAFASCGGDPSDSADSSKSSSSALDGVWTTTEPAGAKAVLAVKSNASTGDDVVVIGRVKDFSKTVAAFTLIDSSLKSCRETKGDLCKTPWDYCCVEPDTVAAATINIEFHDEAGRPHRKTMKGMNELDHLETVTIAGKATKDDAGNVRITATQLFKN